MEVTRVVLSQWLLRFVYWYFKSASMILVAFVGLVIRLLFISYFSSGDHYYNGVFTNIVDVDYKVYLDASLYPSPYQRHTYRYSPILSYLMAPSYQYH